MTINNLDDDLENEGQESTLNLTVDRIILQVAPGVEIKPEHKAKLLSLIQTQFKNNTLIELNPETYSFIREFLYSMGYTGFSDINEKSLVIENKADENMADLNKLVTRSKMSLAENANRDYKSNVGVYGFSANVEGNQVRYTRSLIDKLVMAAETFIRKQGDLGGNLLASVLKKPIRRKASTKEIASNIERLGLSKFFEVSGEVIAENLEDFKEGVFLDDILRLNKESNFLKSLDPIAAIQAAGKIIKEIHENSGGGIGEVLANDILLRVKDGKIEGGRISMPDVSYDNEVGKVKQKATDMLDLCFSLGSAGFQNGDVQAAQKYIEAALIDYRDPDVWEEMEKLCATGAPFATPHNFVRLGFDRVKRKAEAFEGVRKIILAVLAQRKFTALPE